jgi:hypothetical protein
LHHDGRFVDRNAAAQLSGELSRLLFWVHHASGPIAVGILTMAVLAAALGYLAASVVWGLWSRTKWQRRRQWRRVD